MGVLGYSEFSRYWIFPGFWVCQDWKRGFPNLSCGYLISVFCVEIRLDFIATDQFPFLCTNACTPHGDRTANLLIPDCRNPVAVVTQLICCCEKVRNTRVTNVMAQDLNVSSVVPASLNSSIMMPQLPFCFQSDTKTNTFISEHCYGQSRLGQYFWLLTTTSWRTLSSLVQLMPLATAIGIHIYGNQWCLYHCIHLHQCRNFHSIPSWAQRPTHLSWNINMVKAIFDNIIYGY